jgi:hypothetical protein
LSGRNFLIQKINTAIQYLDVSNLVKGVYIVTLFDKAGNVHFNQKLIK